MSEELRCLTVVPRTADPATATRLARDVVRWSDELDMDGVLLFTGAGAVLDPWLGAAAIVSTTRRLVPLVALNPLYSHPFAAARSLLSIAELHGRRVDLNLITGAALSELRAVGDRLDHADRYERLQEYVELLLLLLDGRPVTRAGRFYPADGLHLTPALPAGLRPRLYLAGQSADARRTARALGADLMGMPSPELATGSVRAVHFGVLARKTSAQAEAAMRDHFPDDPVGREMLRLSLANTDSVWKLGLSMQRPSAPPSPLRMEPFLAFHADCPYIVGDYDAVAAWMTDTAAAGVHTFVLDSPTTPEDFRHLSEVVGRVRAGPGLR